MHSLERTGPAFLEMAHGIVWASVATVDADNRPRSRVLHPYWEWDGSTLVGWVATGATQNKRSHLEHSPYVSVNYWSEAQNTCVAECRGSWHFDLENRERVWNTYLELPEPLGYDPAIIPGWESFESETFSVLKLEPWRLRVFPASMLFEGSGEVLVWEA